MCGITVVVRLDGHSLNYDDNESRSDYKIKVSTELDKSIEAIAHRGPDSRGTWISDDGRVALGHCRLAINDLSSDGHQPLHNAENDIHAVVNGELYDYDSLHRALSEEFGYKFQGHSDSELVVALYKHYGISFLSELRGEFALCLYDSRTQIFIAARDRYGIKPLFWTITDSRLLVAAEIKAFIPLGWKPQWDVRSLVDEGWQFGCRTLFKGVQTVRPGQYLVCTSFGHVETMEYWDAEYPNKHHVDTRSEDEMIAGIRERLVDAVRLRLRADVPIGIYLSGGIDSSAIAGIATHLVKEECKTMGSKPAADRVACFSIAFDKQSGFDESDIAHRTARWLDVQCHKLHVRENEIAADLEEATYHCEHHNMNLNFVGKFALSRLPRAHGYPVILTGEGADEQFAGYPMFVPDFLRENDHAHRSHAIPEQDRVALFETESSKLADYLRGRGAAEYPSRLPAAVSRELNNLVTANALSTYHLADEPWAEWVGQQFGSLPSPVETMANNLSCRTKRHMRQSWHPLHAGLYAWSKCHLATSILSCLGDRTEMAHSIEARTPFLDHKLTEYVNSLPPSVKLRYDPESGSFNEKWILRQAVKPFITDELYNRHKHAYTAPALYPEGGPLHRLYQRLMTKENVASLGFLSWDKVRTLLHRAFVERELKAMRSLNVCCQWVILAQRFSIPKAVRT